MKARPTALIAALLGCGVVSVPAFAQSPEFKFSGFGTIGAAHSNEQNADYVGSIFQPTGAGHTKSWSFGPDSKLGAQVNATFGDKLSAVVQVVAQHQYDNSWKPQLEWANVKYQVSSDVSVRLGRIALPQYLISESRFVGYANPWVHVPHEVYGVLSITSNDGVDVTWRTRFGNANNTLQAYYGTSTAKLSTGKVKSKPGWGINDSIEIGSLTLRAGYSHLDLDIELSSLGPLFAGLSQFAAGVGTVPAPAYQTAAAQAIALQNKYKLNDMKLSAVAVGASFDPGEWFLMSEFVAFKGDGFLSDSRSWYVSGGYRFGSFTPYLTYSSTKARIENEAGISTTGLDPTSAAGAAGLTAGINATLYQFTGTQNSVSAGLRWDVMKNVALKAQIDRLHVGERSNGRLANVQPNFQAGGHINVVSLAADFVF